MSMIQLKDICTKIGSGATPTGGKSAYLSQGISLIRSQNVLDYTFTMDGLAYINEDQAMKLNNVEVQKGDILLNITGDSVARVCIVPNNVLPARVNQHVAIIRVDEDKADNNYVLYSLIKSKKSLLSLAGGGATRNALTKKMIEEFEIELPQLSIQKKIAAQLSEIDDKIAVNRRICENLEAQAQALFKHWFIDFAPFKIGKFVESELGMIPEGWRVGRLGDVADITMGQSPAGSSYNEKGEGIFFYQGRTEFGFRYPSVRLYTTEPKRFAEPLSTLLSVRAPVGDINVATDKCCIGRGLASIKSNNNCHSYIFYLLQSMKRRFDVYNGEGTVFGSINKDTLNGLKIIIPSNSILLGFEEIVEEMDKKILGCHQENLRLSALRDTLLPKLMSGQIKVNEVEKSL